MTAVSALLLAIISGWLVPSPRLAMAAFLGPWLVALIYQTLNIGLGYAVSPPQTVTQFPRVIGYVVVTAVILALGLVLAVLIAEWRSRVVPDARRTAREMVKRASAAGTIMVAAVKVTGTEVTFRKARQHVLPPAVAADALRIIQEGLTNSMKHAPGAPISVTLEATATGLNVEITNGPARSRAPRT